MEKKNNTIVRSVWYYIRLGGASLTNKILDKNFKDSNQKEKKFYLQLLQSSCLQCSLHSWQFFWCVFSFIVCNVRDTTVQKLRRWGRGRGAKALRTTTYNQPLDIFETLSASRHSNQHSRLADRM